MQQNPPPMYHQDPNAIQMQQQYPPQQQQYPHSVGAQSPPPQQMYGQSPTPQHPQEAYFQGQPQQQRGAVTSPGDGQRQYASATPLPNLQQGSAPVDCPACGQRAMTVTNMETGNTTQ